jgi:hydrogenase maturation protease
MARVLIVGYGNPLRGDDGFGWHAAERLRQAIDDPEVEVLTLHQLTPELMEPLSRVERAIFIDAAVPSQSRGGAAAGSGKEASSFTHHLTPATLIAGAQTLYGHAPETTVLTAPGENFDFGESMSEAMQRALNETVEKVRAMLLRPPLS